MDKGVGKAKKYPEKAYEERDAHNVACLDDLLNYFENSWTVALSSKVSARG